MCPLDGRTGFHFALLNFLCYLIEGFLVQKVLSDLVTERLNMCLNVSFVQIDNTFVQIDCPQSNHHL